MLIVDEAVSLDPDPDPDPDLLFSVSAPTLLHHICKKVASKL